VVCDPDEPQATCGQDHRRLRAPFWVRSPPLRLADRQDRLPARWWT
jgi:hypothetical protein